MSRLPVCVFLSGGSPIDLDGSLFAQLAIFFLAFFILKSLVFRPVMTLFDAREEAVAGSKQASEVMVREAEDKRNHLEGELSAVRRSATEQRDKLRAEAQDLARKLSETARGQSAATLADARTRLDLEARQARERVLATVPDLAKRIAERMLVRSGS